MEIKGKIKVIGQIVNVGTGTFMKRELVVTTDEQYPQHILINFMQDKCDLLDKYQIGDFVEIGINIRGREWTSPTGELKYFNDIQGWKIKYDKELQTAKTEMTNSPMPKVDDSKLTLEDEQDDLPFF